MREPDSAYYPKDGKHLTEEERKALIKAAKPVFLERAAYYASRMQLSPCRITVRTQKTRWGSCTQEGNLNFNALLLLAPPEVLELVVVHELCHLIYMDHSKNFYSLLKSVYPGDEAPRKWLKKQGGELIGLLPKEKLRRRRFRLRLTALRGR